MLFSASAAALLALGALTQVSLDDGQTIAASRVRGFDLQGVLVLDPDGGSSVIAWDRVLDLAPEQAEAAAPYAELHDTCWRAATRLARGDAPAADPLFEKLFAAMDGATGPTASMVCEGRMRCRLAAGDRLAAAEAWLAWLSAGPTEPRFGAASLRDQTTLLEPALPPFDADLWEAAGADPADLPALVAAADSPAAAAFTAAIVNALSENPDSRNTARIQLAAQLEATGDGPLEPWAAAWARLALGRSFLIETDPDARMVGVVQLLHVPALLSTETPDLAAQALADAADALEQLGDAEGARTLRDELRRTYPLTDAARLPLRN